MELTKEQHDKLAEVVVARFRRAKEYRKGYIVHQGISYEHMLKRAAHQYRREYYGEDREQMTQAFGFCPTRYLGVVQQKTNATVAWLNDLVINNLDAMFTATPSPYPEIDKASRERIRRGVRRELSQRIIEAGISSPELLLDRRGKPVQEIEDYLAERVRALAKIEQARVVGLASDSAQAMQTRMRDTMIEGQFRQAYQLHTFDRVLNGNSIIKFPDWQRRPTLQHTRPGKAALKWKVMPWFRHVPVADFYPVCDAIDYQTNTGNTEHTYVTKAELIGMARQPEYFAKEIEYILTEYAYRKRNWLDDDKPDARDSWWELDETIPLLIHEGFFSGDELREYGINGIDTLDYVSARIEVIGGRTIRAQLLRMPGGAERTYFGSPFMKIGSNLLDCIGLGAALWDSEQRVNRLMHLFEHNADWASRPPSMVNRNVFEDPNDADQIVPGGQYNVEDRFATSGTMPEPIRNMNAVSAQYHLLMTQVGAVLRQADEDCGIPAFAYGAQDFGRSSLGEYSQRMSNALRTIKQAALNEDVWLIEPAFRGLFSHLMQTESKLVEGQDVGLLIRGMTGLLRDDERAKREQAVFGMVMQGGQNGMVPEQAVKYAVRRILDQAGYPVDALGMSDPMIDSALAVAAGQPLQGAVPGGPQVPQIDGRSGGVPAAAVAQTGGASNLAIPGSI